MAFKQLWQRLAASKNRQHGDNKCTSTLPDQKQLTFARPSPFKRAIKRFNRVKAAFRAEAIQQNASLPDSCPSHKHKEHLSAHLTQQRDSQPVSSPHPHHGHGQEPQHAPACAIKDCNVRQLVLRLIGATHGTQCWISETKEDTFHKVFVLKFRQGETRAVLKVPIAERWTAQDAAVLRGEALTLQYFDQHSCSAPLLLACDSTVENEINAPFMLTSLVPVAAGERGAYIEALTVPTAAAADEAEGAEADRDSAYALDQVEDVRFLFKGEDEW